MVSEDTEAGSVLHFLNILEIADSKSDPWVSQLGQLSQALCWVGE
jgi:hypothetical protein